QQLAESDFEHRGRGRSGARARVSGDAAFLLRLVAGLLGELGIRLIALDLLAAFFLTFVHRLLEAAHGGPEVGADRLQFLGTEHEQHEDEDDEELFHPDTHKSNSCGKNACRIIGQRGTPDAQSSAVTRYCVTCPAAGRPFAQRVQVSSQNVTGPSFTRLTCMSAPNSPAATGACRARALSSK